MGMNKNSLNNGDENKVWYYKGEGVPFKMLEQDTKEYLNVFQSISDEFVDGKDILTMLFKEHILDLGNEYATIRRGIAEKHSDNKLVEEFEKLEKSFYMYLETNVVGNIKEPDSMANEIHFTLIVAKSDRYIKEAMAAVKNGKSAKSAVKRDITKNDKEIVELVVNQAKKVMENVIKFFNQDLGQVSTTEDIIGLNNFTIQNAEKEDWSFNKLTLFFEMLDKIKGDKENRYSQEELTKVTESEEVKTLLEEELISMLTELFRIFN